MGRGRTEHQMPFAALMPDRALGEPTTASYREGDIVRAIAWIGLFAVTAAYSQVRHRGASLEQRIDALFQAYVADNRPGYVIGIIRGGSLIFAKGYGSADIAQMRPIAADTAFNLASLSKQFTAATIALEIKRGRLRLNDRLVDHWSGLPAFMQDITIAHLVYMTSGLPEYYSWPSPKGGWASEDRFSVDDAIAAVFAAGAFEYKPGTRWSYDNINYQILAGCPIQYPR